MYFITKDNKYLSYDELTATFEFNGDIIINDDVEITMGLVIENPLPEIGGIVVPKLRINGCIIAKSLSCDVDIEVAGEVTITDGNISVRKGISVARSLTVSYGNLIAGGKVNVIDAIDIHGKLIVEPFKTNTNAVTILASKINVTDGIRVCENLN